MEHSEIKQHAELLAQIDVRREREGDRGIFGSVEREILRQELSRIDAEIAASEAALRDGSVPAADAALWYADWVAEKRLLEAEVSRLGRPREHRLTSLEARSESGAYRGLIVGETWRHVVQQLPGHGLVAHKKEDLERSPRAGEHVLVRYSNGQATVRDVAPRSRAKGQER